MTHVSNTNGANNTNADFQTKELRFLARSVGILALLTGLIYIRVLGVETLASLQTKQDFVRFAFLFGLLILGMLGLLCSWRWEMAGGVTAVVSAVGIGILAYMNAGQYQLFSAVAYSSPFFIAGILMLACWWRTQHR